ncbi:cytochrome c oxidase assembly factor Coa1 family protein [Flavobacterium ustbae]|uniref:cytochrome c oxidase assembly factor Coa1 family protein n=1 Tax=Flavobacterium ustbae TaxID=2488790 RepID=UPI000F7A8214|nr:cytochrome c oxidase assembly factor Coa1 family protein [Flavobacterium ustbae]
MENELVENKNWLKKNWIWTIPVLLFFFGAVFVYNSAEGIVDTAFAYEDQSLYQNAIKKANTNTKVLNTIGVIAPIDKLAILEGNVTYSNNKNSINSSVRITGTNKKGKLDIYATKSGNKWEYKKISIRTKNPNEEILILSAI